MTDAIIYTACATNSGWYIALAVAAGSEAQALAVIEPFLVAAKDIGGDYALGDDGLEARFPDEDGDYPNENGSMSMNLDGDTVARLLTSPGTVELLDSGSNG